jgi:hypothetical protein
VKLSDLEPQFIRYVLNKDVPVEVAVDPANYPEGGTKMVSRDQVCHARTDKIDEAQGIRFLCPKCFEANGGPVGTHVVICWSRSRGVPDSAEPGPGRWTLDGTGLADLTLNGDGSSRSVLLLGGCGWHGFITNGEVT